MATVSLTKVKEELYTIYHCDAFEWLRERRRNSIHAVVTDPPYGLVEYRPEELAKMKAGRGGVWRIPPSFDGAKRRRRS
jgi:DNA modification methylase